jgi:hypothetical protein
MLISWDFAFFRYSFLLGKLIHIYKMYVTLYWNLFFFFNTTRVDAKSAIIITIIFAIRIEYIFVDYKE